VSLPLSAAVGRHPIRHRPTPAGWIVNDFGRHNDHPVPRSTIRSADPMDLGTIVPAFRNNHAKIHYSRLDHVDCGVRHVRQC
jgi:hypothetical protein